MLIHMIMLSTANQILLLNKYSHWYWISLSFIMRVIAWNLSNILSISYCPWALKSDDLILYKINQYTIYLVIDQNLYFQYFFILWLLSLGFTVFFLILHLILLDRKIFVCNIRIILVNSNKVITKITIFHLRLTNLLH